MKRWGKMFKATLKKLKIELELLQSYVDDVTKMAVALDPGVRFDETKMKMVKVDQYVEDDQNEPEDRRTMEELRKLPTQCSNVYNLQQTVHPTMRKEWSLYWTSSYI